MIRQVATHVKPSLPNAQLSNAVLQRTCACGRHTPTDGECEEVKGRKGALQRAAITPSPMHDVPSIVHDVLRSPGQPLDAATRAFMGSRFQYDFSRVRIHTDMRAARSARAVSALAYAVGRDVVFGTGRYAPQCEPGRRLIAHELAHVVQQDNHSSMRVASSSPNGPAEQEASQNAGLLVSGRPRVVVSSGPALFRQPAKGQSAPASQGPKRLYEYRYRGHLITKYSLRGIDFLVGVHESMISNIEGNLDAIGAAIVAGNALISDTALQVKTCIIAPTTTRYATYQDKPVLVLDPPNANNETATHEIGHAVFEQYSRTSGEAKSPTKGVAVAIADIFLRLAGTKSVQENERDERGNPRQAEHPAGLWIADPSQWSKTLETEHPWQDADEFFASARKAYLLDPKGFRAAIDKFGELDSAVKPPARELLAFLSQLAARKIPKTPRTLSKDATAHIAGVTKPTKVEATLSSPVREVLKWTVDPTTIPPSKPAGPSITGP
jgi:hypothetical protein